MKAFAFAFVTAVSFAQSFEVASIRPHDGPVTVIGSDIKGPLVTATAFTVHNLITYAYDLKIYQVFGVPSGYDVKERYDISARAPGETPPSVAQVRQMFQALLAERFQVKFHRETRNMDIYALVAAKGDAKLHKPSADGPAMQMNGKSMIFTGAPLSMLARQLGDQAGIDRPVLDKTGLAGTYDFQLNYALNRNDRQLTGPDGESIFTAIEEQLGLKLEKQKAPIEVLVVDSVQKPSEN